MTKKSSGRGRDDVLILSEAGARAEEPLDDEPAGAADPTAAVLAELGAAGSGAFVTVYRAPTRPGQQEAYLGRWEAAEFTLEDLKARHGGGVYNVRGYRPKLEGEKGPDNKRLFVNRQITIEEARDAKPPIAAAVAGAPADLVGVFAEIARMQAAGFDKLGQLIAQSRGAAGDEDKFLERMARYKTLFSHGDGFSPDKMLTMMSGIVTAATGMKDLVGDVGGGKDTNDLDVLMKAMDLFGRPVVEAIARGAGAAAALPAPAAGPGTPPTEGSDMNAAQLVMVRHQLKKLCTKAAANSDPQLWAEVIVDEVPRAKLEELLGTPAWFDRMCALEPACRNYPAWFTALRDEVSALLTPDDPGVDTGAQPPSGEPPVPQQN
jgi:hypothetical protein